MGVIRWFVFMSVSLIPINLFLNPLYHAESTTTTERFWLLLFSAAAGYMCSKLAQIVAKVEGD